jgi:uncharacterized protein
MGRLIVLVLVVVLAVWLIRRALGTSSGKAPRETGDSAGQPQQELVSCARCGVHLPRMEARESGGRLYCGEEHARLGAGER